MAHGGTNRWQGFADATQQYPLSFFSTAAGQQSVQAARNPSGDTVSTAHDRSCREASAAQLPADLASQPVINSQPRGLQLQQLQLQLPTVPEAAEQPPGALLSCSSTVGSMGTITQSSPVYPQSGGNSPCTASYLPGPEQLQPSRLTPPESEDQFLAAGSGSSCRSQAVPDWCAVTPQGWQPLEEQQVRQLQTGGVLQHPLLKQCMQQQQQLSPLAQKQAPKQSCRQVLPQHTQVVFQVHRSRSSSVSSGSYGLASTLSGMIPTPQTLPSLRGVNRGNTGLSAGGSHCSGQPPPQPVDLNQMHTQVLHAPFAVSTAAPASLSHSSSNGTASGDSTAALQLLSNAAALPQQEVARGQNTSVRRPPPRTLAQLRQQQQQFRQLYQQHLQQLQKSESTGGSALHRQQQSTTKQHQQEQAPSASCTAVVAVQRRPALKTGKKRPLEHCAVGRTTAMQAAPTVIRSEAPCGGGGGASPGAGSCCPQGACNSTQSLHLGKRATQGLLQESSSISSDRVLLSLDTEHTAACLATMSGAELLQVAACMLSVPLREPLSHPAQWQSTRFTANANASDADAAANPAWGALDAAADRSVNTGGCRMTPVSSKAVPHALQPQFLSAAAAPAGATATATAAATAAAAAAAAQRTGSTADYATLPALPGSIELFPEQLQAFYSQPMTPAEAAAEARAAADAVLRAAKAAAAAKFNPDNDTVFHS